MQCDSDEEEAAEKSPVEKKVEIQPNRKTEPIKQYVSITSSVVTFADQYSYSRSLLKRENIISCIL